MKPGPCSPAGALYSDGDVALRVETTVISGAYLIDLGDVHGDSRGFFVESYQKRRYQEHGIRIDFVQDNRSYSRKGVLRGLHYQIQHPIGHLVYPIRGRIFDVGVDLRRHSPTFGNHIAYILSANKPQQLYLPPGVAHGFCTLEDENEILYKCTDYYFPEHEAGLAWNDPDIGIDWPIADPVIKDRDKGYPRLKDIAESQLPQI